MLGWNLLIIRRSTARGGHAIITCVQHANFFKLPGLLSSQHALTCRCARASAAAQVTAVLRAQLVRKQDASCCSGCSGRITATWVTVALLALTTLLLCCPKVQSSLYFVYAHNGATALTGINTRAGSLSWTRLFFFNPLSERNKSSFTVRRAAYFVQEAKTDLCLFFTLKLGWESWAFVNLESVIKI